jgi:hypothetical protein
VRFYSKDSNTNVGYQPNSSTLVGQWHFVVASFNSATNTENMYWDGNPVATTSITVYPNLSGLTSKTTQFTIGESTVFVPKGKRGGTPVMESPNTSAAISMSRELRSELRTGCAS